MAGVDDFQHIRTWRGTQPSAWEELCYQLRDPTPEGAQLRKVGNPDGGVEWYLQFPDGVQHGWQAKYSFNANTLIKLMERSLRTVVSERPDLRRLTFCIPVDFSDSTVTGSGWQRFEEAKDRWQGSIDGAERVDIDLWSGGDILERLNTPANRGKRWFFWDEDVFGADWCRERLEVALEIADDRYTPSAHVELPVARTLDALALGNTLIEALCARRHEVAGAVDALPPAPAPAPTPTLERRDQIEAIRDAVAPCVTAIDGLLGRDPGAPLDGGALRDATRSALDAAGAAWPDVPEVDRSSPPSLRELHDAAKRLEQQVGRCWDALRALEALLRSPAFKAAERRVLLVTGDAGQGKTHLLCDSTQRRIDNGQPAALILAQGLSTRMLWSSIAENLGLSPARGADELLGAMEAAGEATGRPFVLHIDAINETPDADGWPAVLPRLLVELLRRPWIACAISVRSDFAPFVLPHGGLGDRVTQIRHRGFAGREAEALERYFDRYGLDEPAIPLLATEFANPLFLKLYCEGLADDDLPAPPRGHEHFGTVFDRYLRHRLRRVETKLALDPGDEVPQRALAALVDRYIEAGDDRLPRAEVSSLLTSFAPGRDAFPNTLLGRLLSEGVLTEDLAYGGSGRRLGKVVRFSYQGLADHAIAARALEPVADADALRAALCAEQPLQQWVIAAPPSWLRALSMQLPERFGVELLDAARWDHDKFDREAWLRAFVQTIPMRSASSITDRTFALLDEAQEQPSVGSVGAMEALLSVAAVPDHPLNAERLHAQLRSRPMPERDATWGDVMYDAHEEFGPLRRLIRWAARGPHPRAPDDVVELAALALMWMLATPNRFARDYVTKALAALLRDRSPVMARIVERARETDDPYVHERVAVTIHGALLCSESGGDAVPVLGKLVALLETALPNLLLRDAVRGAHEWALRHGLIDADALAGVSPPYGAAPPVLSTAMAELEERFELRNHEPSPEGWFGAGYSSLFSSLSGLGDFAHYVVEPKVRDFLDAPLDQPRPERERYADRNRAVTQDRAAAWIFERVLQLGWTPPRFALIDLNIARRSSDRRDHKPERFGKKYQWIALRELVARLADNFHYDKGWHDDPSDTYQGPWQMLARDIDPTLPPCPLRLDQEGWDLRGDTFASDDASAWWVPAAPALLVGDPEEASEDWAARADGEPAVPTLLSRTDTTGRGWVTLESRLNWEDAVEYRAGGRDRRQRHLWLYVHGWLCAASDRERLLRFLRERSLMGEWMPRVAELINDAYLGEIPWAAAANEWPSEWERPDERSQRGPIDAPVLPTGAQYFWEGHTRDCSMSEAGARCWVPTRALFDRGGLRWVPGTRTWTDAEGCVVAQYRATDAHTALMVEEEWLAGVLDRHGWALVLGVVGEREFFEAGWNGGHIGGWTTLNAISAFGGDGKLSVGKLRRALEMPAAAGG